jgi:nucleoside-diphosphate-sugar epimerase
MRVLVTGGSGVLGRALVPRLLAQGHEVAAPLHGDLDLFSSVDVRSAVKGIDAVYHLATRIPPPERAGEPMAWEENDNLRSKATAILVDAASAAGVETFILPSVTFMYPSEGTVDEETPLVVGAGRLRSMRDAEAEVRRFTETGGRGVVLRLGLLWGPHTGNDSPDDRRGATLHAEDAGEALLLALTTPAGIYNVVGDGEHVSNARFKTATGWKPPY